MISTIIVTSMTGLVTKKIKNFLLSFCRENNKYRMRLRVFTLGFTELIESVS